MDHLHHHPGRCDRVRRGLHGPCRSPTARLYVVRHVGREVVRHVGRDRGPPGSRSHRSRRGGNRLAGRHPGCTRSVRSHPVHSRPVGTRPVRSRPEGSHPPRSRSGGVPPGCSRPDGGSPGRTRRGDSRWRRTAPVRSRPVGTRPVRSPPVGTRPGGMARPPAAHHGLAAVGAHRPAWRPAHAGFPAGRRGRRRIAPSRTVLSRTVPPAADRTSPRRTVPVAGVAGDPTRLRPPGGGRRAPGWLQSAYRTDRSSRGPETGAHLGSVHSPDHLFTLTVLVDWVSRTISSMASTFRFSRTVPVLGSSMSTTF